MGDGPTPEQRAQLGAVGVATGLGCSIVVTLIVLIGGGVLLDQAVDTAPVFKLIGVELGLLATGYELYELTRVGLKDRPAGPLGRGLARLSTRRAAGSGRPATEPAEGVGGTRRSEEE